MDVDTPPDRFEGSECESCFGYPGLDVFISTSCLADGASQVGEFVDVFDLLFTQADCSVCLMLALIVFVFSVFLAVTRRLSVFSCRC